MKTLLPILLVGSMLLCAPATVFAKAPADPMATPLGDFNYQGTLRQAIEKIAATAQVRVEVDWNALAASGAKFDAVVKLAASKASPGQLLDSALAQAAAQGNPLTWQMKDGTVRVTTQQRMLSAAGAGNYVPVAAPKAGEGSSSPRPGADDSAALKKSALPTGGGGGKRELSFENTPLSDVLDLCRRAAGVNMHVNWKALQSSSVDKNTPVSLQLTDVAISKLMDLVLDGINAGKDKTTSVYWVIDGGILLVSTGSALDTEMRTKTLDVADLLMVMPNFKAPVQNLSNNGNNGNNGTGVNGIGTGVGNGVISPFQNNNNNNYNNNNGTTNGEINYTDSDKTIAEQRKQLQDTLIAAIQDTIGKDMWEPQGKGSIKLMGKQLVITQSLLGWKLMEKAAGR